MITRLLLPFLLLSAVAAAQPRWEFVEAWGSETGRIIPLPDGTLLTRSTGGIYSSSNKGKEWTLVVKNRSHWLRGISPVTGTLIAMSRRRMFFSTDYGRSWERATVDSADAEKFLAFFAVTADGTFYAATENSDEEPGGVFRSTDDGRSWSCIGLPRRRIYGFVLTKNGTLVVATYGAMASSPTSGSPKELRVTTDGGNTWSEGRPVPWVDGDRWRNWHSLLRHLAVDSVGALYAVTPVDIWKSTDLGVTWKEIIRDTFNILWWMRVASDNSLDLMGLRGVRHSSDGGKSWADGSPRVPHTDGAVLALGPRDLFIRESTGAGIFYSSDSGKSLERRNHGIPSTIQRMSSAGGRLLVYATGEYRTSSDGGVTWQILPSRKKITGSYQSVEYVRHGISDAGTLFAAGDSTLERSSDGGATWSRLEGSAPFTLFIGNGAGDLFGFAPWQRNFYVWIARDDGITWEAHARVDLLRSMRDIVFDGRRAGYAATEKGIVVTRDNGRTWSIAYHGPAYAVTVDRRGSAIAMTDSGVVRSDDHGRSWPVVADTSLRFKELATARDGSIIGYLVSQEYSTVPYDSSTFRNAWILPIVRVYDDPIISYPERREIWRSTDRGATWKPFMEGLPDYPIISFTADRSTGAVYVATEGGGLFRLVGTER